MSPLYSHKAHGLVPRVGLVVSFWVSTIVCALLFYYLGHLHLPKKEKETPNYGINYLTGKKLSYAMTP